MGKTKTKSTPTVHVTAEKAAMGEGKIALVVSCIDRRLTDDVVTLMHNHNPNLPIGDTYWDHYYHFTLAGCGLGADANHGWSAALLDHIKLIKGLGVDIAEVFLIEHRDCGAYKAILGKYGEFKTKPTDPEREKELEREKVTHIMYVLKLADRVRTWYKELEGREVRVRCFLMDVNEDEHSKEPVGVTEMFG